jgi:biopolymer transport protein ExbD
MGEIVQEEKGQKGGKKRAKKQPAHVDMTPMVDLICLLLTFFILTAAFNKPKVMVINMPDKKPTKDHPKVLADRMLNIILGDSGKVYYYVGMIEPGKPLPTLIKSNYSKDGIRKILLEKNKDLFTKITEYNNNRLTGKVRDADTTAQRYIKEWKKADALSSKGGPTVLIKPDDKAKYKNIVALVNEMAITNIAVYAIVDMNKQEKDMLAHAPK